MLKLLPVLVALFVAQGSVIKYQIERTDNDHIAFAQFSFDIPFVKQVAKLAGSIGSSSKFDSAKVGKGVQSGNAAMNSIAKNAKSASKISKYGMSAMRMAGKVAPILSLALDVFFPAPDPSLAAIS